MRLKQALFSAFIVTNGKLLIGELNESPISSSKNKENTKKDNPMFGIMIRLVREYTTKISKRTNILIRKDLIGNNIHG